MCLYIYCVLIAERSCIMVCRHMLFHLVMHYQRAKIFHLQSIAILTKIFNLITL